MHKLFEQQLKRATQPSGEVDLDALAGLVCAAYEEADHDRRRTDRSISLMIEELDGHLRERERTAELLREQKFKLDTALNNMSQGLCMYGADARLVLCNERYMEIMNLPAEFAVPGRTLQELVALRRQSGKVPGDPQQLCAELLAAIAEGKTVSHVVQVGNGREVRVVNQPMASGGWVATFEDVTDQRRAERERDRTEQQLHQMQKMDAIGQLTGGIAHDLNNILTVITGTIEILADAVADRPQCAAIAGMIDQAAGRAGELTGHLLAVARKQPLRPRETDVNALIVDTTKLLRASLGEHVEIKAMLEQDAAPALVDPSQLTTALLNLAVNARDAMLDGGNLTLETGNVFLDEGYSKVRGEVAPGYYVMIAVSDTGSGIPAAIRDKVFEPFFTTKGPGKGTGLGLSMVYGFVKQSGGHVRIHSEEGHGTTVKLYLPRAAAQALDVVAEQPKPPPMGGGQTILVVEDDALVRRYVTAQLLSLGYRTLEAANAAEALAVADRGMPFDLLFTDIIMPGAMNGRQLAQAVEARRPNLKVLFTSGYTENALLDQGRLPPGVLLLAKPYRKSELARTLRQALEAHPCLSAA
jgi:signal transduction histidine kinase/CheY-like chemotaxis protein